MRWTVPADLTRWSALFAGMPTPTYPETGLGPPMTLGGTPPVRGVLWAQTLRLVSGVGLTDSPLRLAAHYEAGPVGSTIPIVPHRFWVPAPFEPVAPLPVGLDFCLYCGDDLPIAWLGFPCLDPRTCVSPDTNAPMIALASTTIVPGPGIDPPGLGLFAGLPGSRWVTSTEPASLVGATGLRFAALGATAGGPTRLLSLGPDGVTVFGKLSCNKIGCRQVVVAPDASPLTESVEPAGDDAIKTSRTDFSLALSGVDNTLWVAGGVDSDGTVLHDVVAYYAIEAAFVPISTLPLELGRVTALAWNGTERRLYALDVVEEGHRSFTRLVSIAPDGSGGREEARWRQIAPADVFVLSFDELGRAWLGAARATGRGQHVVGRLSRGAGGVWELDGVARGTGSLHRDGAYANLRGLSLAVVEPRGARLLGYSEADLRPHPGLEPWL